MFSIMESIRPIGEQRNKFIRELARALARRIASEDYAVELASEESVG